MPPQLRELAYNPRSGYYEIQEDGILYRMDLEETRLLKDYFRDFKTNSGRDYPTVAGWYQDLKRDAKKKVARAGKVPALPPGADGFYPDPVYPD